MKANKYLEEKEIDFETVKQDKPTKGCDEAARERGVNTNQIVKSLIIERNEEKGKKENTETVHALLPGDREISEKKFGEHRLIPPEESKELTGFERGTVHPFSTQIHHIIDYRLLQKEKLSFTIGQTQKGVIIKTKEFQKALEKSRFNYQIKDISLHNQKDIQQLQEKGLSEEQAKFIAKNGLAPRFTKINHDSQETYKVLEELERHETEYNLRQVEEILEAAEGQNHLQKIVEEFAKTGEITQDDQEYNLEKILEELEKENPQPFEEYREGKEAAINFIIGKVMEETKGRANPEQIKQKLKE